MKIQALTWIFSQSLMKRVVGQNGLAFPRKATPVATVHRTVAKSRLSSPFYVSRIQLFAFHFDLLLSGGPKWTRTIDLTIISRVL